MSEPGQMTLDRLVAAGVATHRVRFQPASDGGVTEQVALAALCAEVVGSVFRIRPWTYAFHATGTVEEIEALLAARLGESALVAVETLAEAEQEHPPEPVAELAHALLADAAETEGPEDRAVIDAEFALRLADSRAETLAAGTGELAEISARLDTLIARLSPEEDRHAILSHRIAAMSRRLDRFAATREAYAIALEALRTRIEAVYGTVISTSGAVPEPFPDVEISLPLREQDLPAMEDPLEATLGEIRQTLAQLREPACAQDLAALREALETRLDALGTLLTEPGEGFARLGEALTGEITGQEQRLATRIEQVGQELAAGLRDVAGRLDAPGTGNLEEVLAVTGDALEERIAGIAAQVAELATALSPEIQAGALEELSGRIEELAGLLRNDDPVLAAVEAQAAILHAIAEREDPAAALAALLEDAAARDAMLARIVAAVEEDRTAPLVELVEERLDTARAAELRHDAILSQLSSDRDRIDGLSGSISDLAVSLKGEMAAGAAGRVALADVVAAAHSDIREGTDLSREMLARMDAIDRTLSGEIAASAAARDRVEAALSGLDGRLGALDAARTRDAETLATGLAAARDYLEARIAEQTERAVGAIERLGQGFDAGLTPLREQTDGLPALIETTAQRQISETAAMRDALEAVLPAALAGEMATVLAGERSALEARLAGLEASLARLAERPDPSIAEIARERDALNRVATGLESSIHRLAIEVENVAETAGAVARAGNDGQEALAARITSLEAAVSAGSGMAADALRPEIAALATRLEAIESRLAEAPPASALDFSAEREEMHKLAATFQGAIRRLGDQVDLVNGEALRLSRVAGDGGTGEDVATALAPLIERLDSVEAAQKEIREALKSIGRTGGAEGPANLMDAVSALRTDLGTLSDRVEQMAVPPVSREPSALRDRMNVALAEMLASLARDGAEVSDELRRNGHALPMIGKDGSRGH